MVIIAEMERVPAKGVLASWMVDPANWIAFLALNEQLNARNYEGTYFPDTDNQRPHSPVRVEFRDREVLINGERCSLKGAIAVHQTDGPPPTLIFRWQTLSSESGSDYTKAVRVPIAPGALDDAARVRAHFAQIILQEKQQWENLAPLRRNICLAISATALGVFGMALYLEPRIALPAKSAMQPIAGIAMTASLINLLAALVFQKVIWGARPDRNRTRRGRNILLVAGIVLLLLGGLALGVRKYWKGDAQFALDIVGLIGVLAGPGAFLIAWVLHIKRHD
jgi:hypothetical protein